MSWIDDINNASDIGVAFRYEPPKSKPKKKEAKKPTGRGGTLTSLISEGGALGGAAAGATVGSVVPIVGTALGGVIGGALGAFGGRIAENKVRDDRVGIGDAAKEAALTAALGAPIRTAKYAVNAAKTAKGGATLADALKAGARAADKKPIQSASPSAPGGMVKSNAASTSMGADAAVEILPAMPKTGVAGRLEDLANKALTSQYGTIGKPIARKTNPEATFGQLAGYGLTKPADVERVSTAITGADGILNKAVVGATGNSARVDVSNLKQTLNDALENYGVVGKEAKELTTMFDAQMKKLMGGPTGSLAPDADPSDVLDVMKAFEKRIAQKTGKGGNYRLATDATTSQANALRLVVDELRDRLESGADIKQVLTPELRQNLLSLNPSSPDWQRFVDNDVMNSTAIQNLRGAQAPFVRAKEIIDEADINSMTFGGRMPASAAGIKDALMGALTGPAMAPVARASSKVLRTASKVAGNASPTAPAAPGKASLGMPGVRSGAQGQAGEGLITALTAAPMAGAAMAPTDSDLSQVDLTSSLSKEVLPTSQQVPELMEPQSPFDPALSQQNAMRILASGGTMDDVAEYLKIVEIFAALNPKPTNDLNSTTATQVAASANATNTLDQLEGLFNTAGGGAGKLEGTLKNTLSKAGLQGDVQTYNDLSASSVSQLARALNGGGQVSDADAAVVIQALPKITDSPEVAARKFAALRARLQAARQNTLTYNGVADPAAESTLEGALAL